MTATPNALQDILAGTIGGILQVLTGHPLDTCKVRLQTQVTVAGMTPKYTGVFSTLNGIYKQEGIAGWYAGVASPLIGVAAMNAAMFASYGRSKALLGGEQRKLKLNEIFLAGMMTGFAIAFVEGPFDHLKCKLQAQVPGQKDAYKGVLDAGWRIGKEFGIKGIYQGLGATILRNVPANGFYFLGYEGIRQLLTAKEQSPSMPTNFVAGGMAGVAYWSAIYPLELVKSRIQSDASLLSLRKYSGIVDCFSKTLKMEGVSGFYKGFGAALLRSFPANSFCFLGYELAISYLRKS